MPNEVTQRALISPSLRIGLARRSAAHSNRASRARRGSALVYVTSATVALVALSSLAVDLGRVYLVRAELQLAADAAARYAVAGLPRGIDAARANAVAAARDNKADGTPVDLITWFDRDVEFGRWDAGTCTFTQLFGSDRDDANAIRVTARRTALRGNAVPLLFAQVIGRRSCDVTASATAMASPAFAVVGLNALAMRGNARTDSYDSAFAPYGPGYGPDRGGIASNGPITLDGGGVNVGGDAREYEGSPSVTNGATVSGSTRPLPGLLSAPPTTGDGYSYASNDNGNIPSAYRPGQNFSLTDDVTLNIPSGNYFFYDFTMTAGVLNVTGPATFYVSGELLIDNDARTSAHRPHNLRFRLIGPGTATFKGNYGVYADVYGPERHVLLDSNKHLYGRVLARTVFIDSNAQVHFDESLSPSATIGSIVLVR
jgi:Flp pilus assembly protein TadG